MKWEDKISKEVVLINIDKLVKSPLNPREFLGNIEELTDTVIDDGVIEPLIVREHPEREGIYEVLCGWRRCIAASRAGYKKVPCRIANVSNEEALILIGIEDIQKEELLPYERGKLYQKMLDELGLSHRQLGAKLGIPAKTIEHYLWLLRLPDDIAKEVRLAAGQFESPLKTFTLTKAEAIIGLPERLQRYFYEKIRTEGMTRDELRKQVRLIKELLAQKGTVDVKKIIEYLENPPEVEKRIYKLTIELPEEVPREKIKEIVLIVEENGVKEIRIPFKVKK
ncbi:MAG: hypothetical protein DRN15_09495 [Thermoprotei archaeon]|nr:MAG: hypothetical protein DRN15_09495 [Thermoprotei archaeon]